jgi:hypothetical protein
LRSLWRKLRGSSSLLDRTSLNLTHSWILDPSGKERCPIGVPARLGHYYHRDPQRGWVDEAIGAANRRRDPDVQLGSASVRGARTRAPGLGLITDTLSFAKYHQGAGSIMREVKIRVRMKLADAMGELRIWLDRHNYVPVSFDITREEGGALLVRIVFSEDHMAEAFLRDFGS